MAWSKVQDEVAGATTSTTVVAAYPVSVTAGNLLLVIAYLYTAGDSTQSWEISDTQGNTWLKVCDLYNSSSTLFAAAWVADANATGACTVTASWTDAEEFFDAVLAEFSGLSAAVSQDGSTQTASGTGTTINEPSFTPGVAGDLVVEVLLTSGGITAIGSPWTAGDYGSELPATQSGWGWLQGTLSTVTAAGTDDSSSDGWGAIVFGIKAAAPATDTGNFLALT